MDGHDFLHLKVIVVVILFCVNLITCNTLFFKVSPINVRLLEDLQAVNGK